jgi:hypothetical protein
MRRIIAATLVLALLIVGVLGAAPPASAGTATNVALGLAAFAVFNQIVAPLARPYPAYAYYPRAVVYPVVQPVPVVYYQPPVVYQTPPGYQGPAVYQTPPAYQSAGVYPAPPAYQSSVVYQNPPVAVTSAAPSYQVASGSNVVYYPHGRYELHLQGGQYVWVWIPNAPPPPPPAPSTTTN